MDCYGDCPVSFSRDGKRFLTGREGGGFQVWERNPEKNTCERLPSPERYGVVTAVFSPDGQRLLTGHDGHGAGAPAQLWDVKTGKPVGPPLEHLGTVTAVAFSPDGKRILTGSYDGMGRVWDARTGKPLGPPLQHQGKVNGKVNVVAFSPDGKSVLTGSDDRTTRLWEVATGKALGPPLANGSVQTVAFSPDGRIALTHGPLRLWDVRTCEPLGGRFGDLPKSPANPVTWPITVAFCADGRSLLISYQGSVQRWEVRTRKVLGPRLPLPHPDAVVTAFHPDGKTVLLRHQEKGKGSIMQPWDLAADQALGPPVPTEGAVLLAVFSPDGESLLTAEFWTVEGQRQTGARLRETRTGKEVRRLILQNVAALAFSPDGHTILTGSYDYTARLWDARTGQPLGPPLQHQDKVSAVGFSPDGKTILTGSWDRTARLWDVKTGKPLGPPLLHRGLVMSVAFSPNGKLLLTGEMDTTKSDLEGAQFWEGPAAVAGDAERILRWVEVITGLELDEYGTVRVIDAPTWQERRRRLQEHGGPPA
jgi:WD40 repeat protein